MLVNQIEEKQINQKMIENKKKTAIKRMRTKFNKI